MDLAKIADRPKVRRIDTDDGSKGQIAFAGSRDPAAGADSHGVRRLLCTQVLHISRVPTLPRKAFPQKLPIFPAFCLAKTFFSRFFSHSANIAGICCVVIIVGFPPRLSTL